MASYHLQIVTPDGPRFDGQAEKLIVRASEGDVCILARHINYVTALGMGVARITVDGQVRRAACIGGMLSVHNGEVKLVASAFEWAEDIDLDRARRAGDIAGEKLSHRDQMSDLEIAQAEAALKRALVRQSAAGGAV